MQDNQDGMHLEFAILNNQVDQFNKWCGSQTNSSIFASNFSYASFEVSNALTVAPPSNCFYNPNQFLILGSGTVIILTNHNSNDPGCASIPAVDTNDVTSYDRFIADSLDDSNLPIETIFQLRRFLAFKLVVHSNLIARDSSMYRFWNSEQTSEPIKMANYDFETRNIFDSIEQDSDLLVSAIQNFRSSYSEISIIDSLISIDSTFSDESMLLRRDDESKKLDSLKNLIDSLKNINNEILMANATEISDRLTADNLVSDLAILERQFLMFQLKYGPWSNEVISDADSNLIIEIANRCLYTNGLPVSRARAYYASWFDDIIEDDDLCNNNYRLVNPLEKDNFVSSFSLSPNPTKDQLNVKINSKEDENSFKGNLNIYSCDSKLIATFELSSYNTSLNVSGIVNGLYIVEIISNDKQFERKKLIVLK